MTRIVVIGGTGRIGSMVTSMLTQAGHEVVVASPSTGVDAATGAGLSTALRGAQTVVDVSKPNTYEDAAVRAYFTRATTRIAAAERDAGVEHHVLLTTVGARGDRGAHGIPYYDAKVAAEDIVVDSGIPFTLVRSTQFFEFFGTIADASMRDGTVRLPGALVQPIAGNDTAAAVVEVATAAPSRGEFEIAGPEVMRLDEFVRRGLAARRDRRPVVRDAGATYFGGHPGERALLPGPAARVAATRFDEWLAAHRAAGRAERRAHVRPREVVR